MTKKELMAVEFKIWDHSTIDTFATLLIIDHRFFAKHGYWENKENPPKMQIFLKNARFLDILVFFLDFLRKGIWQRLVVFLCCVHFPKTLLLSYQNQHLKILSICYHKGGPFGFRGGQNRLVRIYVTLPRKQDYFWNP